MTQIQIKLARRIPTMIAEASWPLAYIAQLLL
jgi:hypothetical protein